MSPYMPAPINWQTGAFADTNGNPVLELDGLCHHMKQCSAQSRRVLLRCGLDSIHQGMVGRFVTSLILMAALVGTTVLLW